MFKHLLTSFFFAFFGVLIMLFLYIWIPHFLSQKFSPKIVDTISQVLPRPSGKGFTIPASPSPSPSPSPLLTPVTLIIPKLNIQSAVEPVGLTPTDNMDVPKKAEDVAWYMYGVPPSLLGNAVIAGHYDTPTGKPAIFYHLGKLAKGDEVVVISMGAVQNTFVVSEVSTIPFDIFPSDYVFKTKPGKNLNLITCGGIWNRQKKIYSDRIVVYTTLKEELVP